MTVAVTFPLSPGPRHQGRLSAALDHAVRFLTDRVPAGALTAVVLTGSFARGEGTVLEADGRLRVLGDLEFFAVPTPGRPRGWIARLGDWSAGAARELAAHGLRATIEYGALDLRVLRRPPPSIFVHDLRLHGKVVWGQPHLLERMPAVGPERIAPADALYLLLNRVVEQLEAHQQAGRLPARALPDLAYQQVKLALDLAGSVLAFTGRHTARYRERPAAFARLLAETPSLAARVPPGFAGELAEAAAAKLDPAAYLAAADSGGEAARAGLRQRIAAAVPTVTAVAGWELERLLGMQAGGRPVPLPALLDRLLRWPGPWRRLRDWAKVILNPQPAPLAISHLRAGRLAWRSTPRILTYVAAMEAYQALAGGPGQDPTRLLPLAPEARPREAAAGRQAIVAFWQWAVRNA